MGWWLVRVLKSSIIITSHPLPTVCGFEETCDSTLLLHRIAHPQFDLPLSTIRGGSCLYLCLFSTSVSSLECVCISRGASAQEKRHFCLRLCHSLRSRQYSHSFIQVSTSSQGSTAQHSTTSHRTVLHYATQCIISWPSWCDYAVFCCARHRYVRISLV